MEKYGICRLLCNFHFIDGGERKRCIWSFSSCCEECCFKKYWSQEIGLCLSCTLCWRAARFGTAFHINFSEGFKGKTLLAMKMEWEGCMNIYRHKVVADIKLKREFSYYDLIILLILNSLDYFQSDVYFS